MRVLNHGKSLSPGDLGIVTRDAAERFYDPAEISYSIFRVSPEGTVTLASPPRLSPGRSSQGVFYVTGSVPTTWEGTYKLVWYMRQYPNTDEQQIFEEFEVVRMDSITTSFDAPSVLVTSKPGLNPKLAECIVKVRHLLSDEEPDRNYHFRPPTPGRVVAGFNQRVGFIWTDETIIRMLRMSIQMANTWNPLALFNYRVETAPEAWREAIAIGAASWCLGKEAARWESDQFEYSLNGVSLSLHKAQEYQSLQSQYSAEFKEWLPLLTANRPCTMGVAQQRWLLG